MLDVVITHVQYLQVRKVKYPGWQLPQSAVMQVNDLQPGQVANINLPPQRVIAQVQVFQVFQDRQQVRLLRGEPDVVIREGQITQMLHRKDRLGNLAQRMLIDGQVPQIGQALEQPINALVSAFSNQFDQGDGVESGAECGEIAQQLAMEYQLVGVARRVV